MTFWLAVMWLMIGFAMGCIGSCWVYPQALCFWRGMLRDSAFAPALEPPGDAYEWNFCEWCKSYTCSCGKYPRRLLVPRGKRQTKIGFSDNK